jgi:hypothetical protein
MRINYWKFYQCGRELNWKKVNELEICPAIMEARVYGINNGKNAGR